MDGYASGNLNKCAKLDLVWPLTLFLTDSDRQSFLRSVGLTSQILYRDLGSVVLAVPITFLGSLATPAFESQIFIKSHTHWNENSDAHTMFTILSLFNHPLPNSAHISTIQPTHIPGWHHQTWLQVHLSREWVVYNLAYKWCPCSHSKRSTTVVWNI